MPEFSKPNSVDDETSYRFAEARLEAAFQAMKRNCDPDFFGAIIVELLDDQKINFGTQVYAWLSDLMYEAAKQSQTAWEAEVWRLIRVRIENGISETEQSRTGPETS